MFRIPLHLLQLGRGGTRVALLGLTALALLTAGSCGEPAIDRDALIAFYNATGGASWQDNANWLSDKPLREWHGVTTDANGRVTELILIRNNLTGPLPPELGHLTHLTWLNLAHNGLTGPLPPELGQLTNLKELRLDNNNLAGLLPAELGSLTNLQELWVFNNDLSGPLPHSLTRLMVLENFRFRGTELCGPATSIFQSWLLRITVLDGKRNCSLP